MRTGGFVFVTGGSGSGVGSGVGAGVGVATATGAGVAAGVGALGEPPPPQETDTRRAAREIAVDEGHVVISPLHRHCAQARPSTYERQRDRIRRHPVLHGPAVEAADAEALDAALIRVVPGDAGQAGIAEEELDVAAPHRLAVVDVLR